GRTISCGWGSRRMPIEPRSVDHERLGTPDPDVNARYGVVALLAASAVSIAADRPTIEGAAFSPAQPRSELPARLQPLTFPGVAKRTEYRLVDDGGTTVLRADAQGGGSGLMHRGETDPRSHPILSWRWKIARVVAGSDATQKYSDDYAARVYVMFKHEP